MEKQKNIVFCIPLKVYSVPPPDQPGCIESTCEYCPEPVWISEKKREIIATDPGSFVALCGECAIKELIKRGHDKAEIIDLVKSGDLNKHIEMEHTIKNEHKEYRSEDKKKALSECQMEDVSVKVQIDVSETQGIEVRLVGSVRELAAALATAMDSEPDFADAMIKAIRMVSDKQKEKEKQNG